jgi:hypothetical protein
MHLPNPHERLSEKLVVSFKWLPVGVEAVVMMARDSMAVGGPIDQPLEVLGEAAIMAELGEGALDHPALGPRELEALGIRRA